LGRISSVVTDKGNRELLLIAIAATSVIVSFFDIGDLPFDAA